MREEVSPGYQPRFLLANDKVMSSSAFGRHELKKTQVNAVYAIDRTKRANETTTLAMK